MDNFPSGIASVGIGPLAVHVEYRRDPETQGYATTVHLFDRSVDPQQEFFRIDPFPDRPHYHRNFEGTKSETVEVDLTARNFAARNMTARHLTRYFLDEYLTPLHEATRTRPVIDAYLSENPQLMDSVRQWIYESIRILEP